VTRDFGYDAERHQLRVFSAGDGVMALHPAWPIPLPESESDYLRYEATAASVRAMLAELDPATPVEETTFLARPAWRASLPSVWNGSPELTVIVDKETGLLMETRRSGTVKAGSYLDVLRITRFDPDPPLDAGWQTVPLLTKPSGTDDWNSFRDIGTRFGGTKSVAERAWPTLPLLPQWAPEGYRLSAMANAVYEDMRPGHDEENSWHWKAKIVRRPGKLPGLAISKRLALKRCAQGVLVLYRRGFGTFTVEVSPRIPGEPGMGTLPRESRQTMQETVLSGGYLKGARARTWISSALLPVAHVWGDSMYVKEQGPTLLTYSDRSQVVIYGDLTRQELIDVANSLQVHGDVEKPLPAGYGD
jgi:(2Fe-2S) ferredoxin